MPSGSAATPRAATWSSTRLAGLFLFLFIPLVLVLYLRMPFGVGPSVIGGIAIMLAHRFVAGPFFERHLHERCYWCGRDVGPDAPRAVFASRGRPIEARACSAEHADAVLAFARFVGAVKLVLAVSILGPVLVYLVNALAAASGLAWVPLDAARWGFKGVIAAAVVGTSFLWPIGRRLAGQPAIDLPPHNLSLLGARNTLWVFRVVGLWWLAEGAWRLGRASSGA